MSGEHYTCYAILLNRKDTTMSGEHYTCYAILLNRKDTIMSGEHYPCYVLLLNRKDTSSSGEHFNEVFLITANTLHMSAKFFFDSEQITFIETKCLFLF